MGGGGDRGVREAETKLKYASEESDGVGGPDAGQTECFLSFSFLSCLFSVNWGEGDQGAPL